VQQCLDLQGQADPGFDHHAAARMLTDRNIATNDSVHSLSKGKLQTLLAACALGRPAPILLLDEPAEGMDIKARRDFYRAVRNHVDDHGSTAVISTHILHDIEPVADEIAIIHGGRLLLHESLEDMRDRIRILPPSDLPVVPLPPDSETIASSPDGTRMIRTRSSWPDPVLPPLRPFSLEELFLALTTIPGEDS
jgi:ABC-2 type transport system ATP-binding protein